MATLQENITALLTLYTTNPKVKSTESGEEEDYDTSKTGVLYPRAYLKTMEASMYSTKFKLIVTDTMTSTASDRLDKESSTLTLIKELVTQMKNGKKVRSKAESVFTPTGIYQRDSTIGWYTEFEVLDTENINICNL